MGTAGRDTVRLKESWRHPLVEELNKDVYNFAADLQSVVESGAVDDASRMIASLEANQGSGLTPSGGDRTLFVSLGVAVKLAIARQPALREELNQKLGPLAELRVKKAIASSDEPIIELAACAIRRHFSRRGSLSMAGRPGTAERLVRPRPERLPSRGRLGPSVVSGGVSARARLAGAMLGIDYGLTITKPVAFGDLHMSPGEFETLVGEMRARGTGTVLGSSASGRATLPAPSQLEPQNRSRFDGPAGQNPHDDGARFISQWQIDYAGRQLATTIADNVLYTSNRFQLAAYNAKSGERLWQSQTPSGETRRGQDWALIPMRPSLRLARCTPGSSMANRPPCVPSNDRAAGCCGSLKGPIRNGG